MYYHLSWFSIGIDTNIALEGEHALDAFVRIKVNITSGPVLYVLKSMVYGENALGIFTRVADHDVICVLKIGSQ